MAVFTSDSVDSLNSVGDKKLRSYLYKLNEDLIYMFNNLTPEDNYSDTARLVYVETQDNVARLEVRADGIELEVKDNAENISNLSVQADEISANVSANGEKIGKLSVRADEIAASVSDNSNNISSLSMTVDGISTTVSNNSGKITSLTQSVDGVKATATNIASNYNTSMQLLANMFSLGVNTPSGSSSMVLTGDKISLSTGKFTINAKNFSVDSSGNATFSGDISGATLTGCDIVGGSINIAEGSFYADSGVVKLGDFQVSTNNAYQMYSGDGSYKVTTANSPGGSVATVVVGASNNQTEIQGGNITSTGVLHVKAVYDTAKYISEFYDIRLGKSWWNDWTITETVKDLWEQVDDLSDETVKENIYDIDSDEALKFILATRTVTFQYKRDGRWSAGMIAQEVDALQESLDIYYPLVELDSRSQKYRIEYKNYIPLLVSAVQNLQAQITELKGETDGDTESTVSESTD